jgi:hypothetical protein
MDHEAAKNETERARQIALAEGYRQTAADREQQREAEEWSEALLVDVSEVDPVTAQF